MFLGSTAVSWCVTVTSWLTDWLIKVLVDFDDDFNLIDWRSLASYSCLSVRPLIHNRLSHQPYTIPLALPSIRFKSGGGIKHSSQSHVVHVASIYKSLSYGKYRLPIDHCVIYVPIIINHLPIKDRIQTNESFMQR